MKLHILNRNVHYWTALIAALPVPIIVVTGLMLQVKKQLAWIQPTEQRCMKAEPTLTLVQILEISRGIPECAIQQWSDIARIDYRPSRGLLKVIAKNNWELQIDTANGSVLQVAYRRSDIIEAIHDGSWFHGLVKYGIYVPTGVLLLVLWATGLYLFWLPIGVKWRRKRNSELIAKKTK